MTENFQQHYSEDGLWDKARKFSRQIGREVLEKALVLYYTGIDEKTPKWAKTVLFTALGYLILPLDTIPDLTPGLGFADDTAALLAAAASVASCISEKHRQRAKQKIKTWFKDTSPANPSTPSSSPSTPTDEHS